MVQQGWMLWAAVAAFAVFAIVLFNTMIGRRNMVSQAFSTIDVMCRKRFDLIPNLVAAVERYMKHERELLDRLTTLRAAAAAGRNPEDPQWAESDNQVTMALRTLFAVAENYPALRASENFLQVQAALNETEEQLAAARRTYNAAVTDFNNGVQMFPLNVVSRLMGYRVLPWLEIPAEERAPVKVWR